MIHDPITPHHPSINLPRRPTRLAKLLMHEHSEPTAELVNVLTDAMHWCDVHNEDFQKAFHLARVQYLAEFRLMLAAERNRR